MFRQRPTYFVPAKRKKLSFDISKARVVAKQAWNRELVDRAASDNWIARKYIPKYESLHAALWPMVILYGGDKDREVDLVAEHSRVKFGSDVHCDLSGILAGLWDMDEGLFSIGEISDCLSL